jgi:uncharacterized protein YidB (DUF937 family)
MSFLNSILNELGDGNSNFGDLAKSLLQDGGGKGALLDSVVGALKENGMEDKVASWVGNGDNESISSGQLSKALGPEMISKISEKTGVSEDQISSALSSLLPLLVNKLTPEGKEQGEGGSLVSSGMNILKGLL